MLEFEPSLKYTVKSANPLLQLCVVPDDRLYNIIESCQFFNVSKS